MSPWSWPLRLLLAGHFFFSIAIVPHTLYWVDYLARGLNLGIAEGGFQWSVVGLASIGGPWSMAALGLLLGTAVALPLSFITLGLGIGAPLFSSAGGVLLLSAPGAAGFLGPRPWRALVASAPAFPDALCCGDAAGDALAALREGCRILVLDQACPAFAQVAGAAAEAGAILLPARPPALDLAGLDLRRAGACAKLTAWLAGSGIPAA